jgi:probable phosphomutase (TIGR03848 family)
MSEQVTRILLIRHAHNPYLDTGCLAGRIPGVHLSDRGRDQAKALAERLASVQIAAIYSSPMERAVETAEPVAISHGVQIQIIEDLQETDCGEWTGRRIEELMKTDLWPKLQAYPSGTSHPGGEGLQAVQGRMVRAIDAICAAHPGALAVVVSHADPLRAALAHYTGLHLDLFQRLVVDPASVSELAFTSFGPKLIRCNDTAHLA